MALLPRLAGLEKADSFHAGKGAGSVTHRQGCDTFLEGEVAGSTGIKAQAHVPHGPATSQISRISHKYLVIFLNTYVYTCSLQCLNSERLETTVCHQGNSLQFTASLSYKTLFSG